jgi:para-aminobenzoate synthetase component 1
MLNWAERFNIFSFLDNHNYDIQPGRYECLLGAGIRSVIDSDNYGFTDINSLLRQGKWVFGHISYEQGLLFHQLFTKKENKVGFPFFFFFEPQIVCFIKDGNLHIYADDPDEVFSQILGSSSKVIQEKTRLKIKSQLSKEDYIQTIQKLKEYILRGDCYEINYCQKFISQPASINPLSVFTEISMVAPNPFSAFYKLEDKFLICASPERFLARQDNILFSQPMKGTAKRSSGDVEKDEQLKNILFNSEKDRSENVMVVDLIRNDLSKICSKGSVQVEELFGIYTYPFVHQMISTIRGKIEKHILFSDIIKAMFPMGSMTGAPKKRVMELIEQYEMSGRGIFSGSVGYVDPEGNFDFNVVIRSIMYNNTNAYLEYAAGSAITFNSDPEKEWEECLLKGEAIKKVLT